jgi:hypothetical protein
MPTLRARLKELHKSGDFSRALTLQMFPAPRDKLDTTHREHRYKLDGPPRQTNDLVIQMVIRTILVLRKKHMLFAVSNVWVHTLDSKILWPNRGPGTRKLYAFTQALEEFPLATEVRVINYDSVLTPDNIHIRKCNEVATHGEHWTPLRQCLLQLPISPKIMEGTTKAGLPREIHCQQLWWSITGKHFPLMKLPKELRTVVYEHALGENVYPHYHRYIALGIDQLILGSDHGNCPGDDEDFREAGARPHAPNYKILALNKRIRQEALEAGWNGTWKHFVSPFYLINALSDGLSPLGYNWLTRLQLNFTLDAYFTFFGVSFAPIAHRLSGNGDVLQGIGGLKHLELFFRSPYGPSARWNPWSHFYDQNHCTGWFRGDSNYKTMASMPCQKIVIDYILAFAFPYIKDIPNIHLAGSIKRCTKEKWYYILERSIVIERSIIALTSTIMTPNLPLFSVGRYTRRVLEPMLPLLEY